MGHFDLLPIRVSYSLVDSFWTLQLLSPLRGILKLFFKFDCAELQSAPCLQVARVWETRNEIFTRPARPTLDETARDSTDTRALIPFCLPGRAFCARSP